MQKKQFMVQRGLKNALSGTLGFNTKLTLTVADYNDMMRSMKGNLSFKVSNGAFGTIGRIENFLERQILKEILY